jgi:uncharacterized membrane protein
MATPTPTHEPGPTAAAQTQYWAKPDEEEWYPEPRSRDETDDADISVAAVPGLATEPADVSTALGRYLATLDKPARRSSILARATPRVRVAVAVALVVVLGLGVFIIANRGGSSPKVDPTPAYVAAVRAGSVGAVVKSAPDAALVGLGRGVCDKLVAGAPGSVEQSMLVGAHGKDFPPADAVVVIRAAAAHLCPVHAAQVRAWDGTAAPQP